MALAFILGTYLDVSLKDYKMSARGNSIRLRGIRTHLPVGICASLLANKNHPSRNTAGQNSMWGVSFWSPNLPIWISRYMPIKGTNKDRFRRSRSPLLLQFESKKFKNVRHRQLIDVVGFKSCSLTKFIRYGLQRKLKQYTYATIY